MAVIEASELALPEECDRGLVIGSRAKRSGMEERLKEVSWDRTVWICGGTQHLPRHASESETLTASTRIEIAREDGYQNCGWKCSTDGGDGGDDGGGAPRAGDLVVGLRAQPGTQRLPED